MLSLNPELIVTCAYGQMVPEAVLNAPKYGCINVHASLLPKYRGRLADPYRDHSGRNRKRRDDHADGKENGRRGYAGGQKGSDRSGRYDGNPA